MEEKSTKGFARRRDENWKERIKQAMILRQQRVTSRLAPLT